MSSDKRTTDVVDNDNSEVVIESAAEAATTVEAAEQVARSTDSDSGMSTLPDNPDVSQGNNETPDPFNPESLRLTQDFAAGLGVEKQLLTVPVRKPSKERWHRVHPDPGYRLETMVLELKEDRELYLIDRKLWSPLAAESTVSPRKLFLAIDRQGTPFLWPVRLPGPDGKHDAWNAAALEAAELATKKWVRVAANMDLGAYDVYTAKAELGDPEWPKASLGELLRIAFKDRMIDSLDHDVLKRLRGEN